MASAATVDPRAALMGTRRRGGGAAAMGRRRRGGGASRERDAASCQPPEPPSREPATSPPRGLPGLRNGREAEISGGYGRAGRPRVNVKNQTKLTEIF